MEKNNNGKLAIAIVAMFVVALSIVGVTYAYFTTTVNGNKLSEEVRVKSGVLRIAYTKGQTITAEGVVPGWQNDGDKFFDIDLHAKLGRGNKIYAISLTGDLTEQVKTDKKISEDDMTAYQGKVMAPLNFKVTNDSSEGAEAYYGIRLSKVTNTIATANPDDADNVILRLYSDATLKNIVAEEIVGTTNGQIITDAITLEADGDIDDYYAVIEYANDTDQTDQNDAQLQSVSVTFEVVGLNKVVNGGTTTYVAANGATWSK